MSREIGDHTLIHPMATIGDNVRIGSHCTIDEFCVVRQDCVIGDYVTMKCLAVLGAGCKVGNECFIGPHVILLHSQPDGRHEPAVLDSNVWVSSHSVILPSVHIVSGTIIGAMSLVHGSITEPGTYFGIPAKKHSDEVYKFQPIQED